MENQNYNKNNLAIPLAIIIAGTLVAGAVLYGNGGLVKRDMAGQKNDKPAGDTTAAAANILDNIRPITSGDHIRGNPNAQVKVVEFSDTECPFCKRFHSTMNRIMDEYGKSGKVAWVYRHFPLDELHSKARKEAAAAECAAETGGEPKFWAFLDRLFEITPSNDAFDMAKLPEVAAYAGLDKNKFNDCLNGGKTFAAVSSDYEDGIKIGIRGTPFSVVVASNGKKYTINGAQPYESVKSIIEQALAEK